MKYEADSAWAIWQLVDLAVSPLGGLGCLNSRWTWLSHHLVECAVQQPTVSDSDWWTGLFHARWSGLSQIFWFDLGMLTSEVNWQLMPEYFFTQLSRKEESTWNFYFLSNTLCEICRTDLKWSFQLAPRVVTKGKSHLCIPLPWHRSSKL